MIVKTKPKTPTCSCTCRTVEHVLLNECRWLIEALLVFWLFHLYFQDKKEKSSAGNSVTGGQAPNIVKSVILQMPGQPKPKPIRQKNPLKAEIVSMTVLFLSCTQCNSTFTLLNKMKLESQGFLVQFLYCHYNYSRLLLPEIVCLCL